jgi:hypothetical protein
METTTITERQELAHRVTDGVEVALLWERAGNRVTVAVNDARTGAEFEFEVDTRCAMDAFNHPYAYAASKGILFDQKLAA